VTISLHGDLALYQRLARQARSSWRHIAMLLLVGLLASPLALLAPLPLKIAVDNVIGSQPLPDFLNAIVPEAVTRSPTMLLLFVALLTLLIAVLSQLQALANKYLTTAAGERLVLDFRARIFRQLQRLSLAYHDSVGTADSVYRIQSDAQAIRFLVIDGFIPSLSAAATLAGMLYVMIRLDWQLTFVALAISPAILLVTRAYRPRLRVQSREVKKLESAAMAVVHEVLGALRIVKAFGQEEREGERFARRSDEGLQRRLRLALAEGQFNVIVGLTTAVGTAAVLFVGIGHVRSGVLTLGDLLLVMGYLGKLYDPIKTISRKMASLQGHLASVERAVAVLDEPADVEERPDPRRIARARGAIAFHKVSFSYGADRPVLHDISFEIDAGTRLGVVGASGAGKSTLINLIARFYDPTDGQILLDGVDIREYRLEDLRRQFGVVPQDPVLFSTSIAENIAYGNPRVDHEAIVAAAQMANAHEFISRLPQSYDTQVGERGVQLSGGQRQRIAIARAFLEDSPVLILDEPTSAVDPHTEAAIVEALERLQQGRTVIIISHRASAVARCSALLRIEHGRLIDDSSRLPAQPPPADAPASLSAKRRETLLAHPAVQAWRQLGPDHAAPDRITPAKVKPNKTRPITVYRLEGVGIERATVIAKRCRRADGLIERTVYEQVLPHVPLPGPRYYGAVPEPHEDPEKDVCWLFIGEVQGEKYDMLLPEHRAAAARWLGILHTEARSAASQAELINAGPGRYRRQMHGARDLIRNHLDNPSFTADDLSFLDGLLARFDELDDRWDRLENAATGLPRTLAHGDFNGKNLRVQTSPGGPQIVAFDWEDSGHGVPTADLAQVVATSCRISASPDLPTYLSVVRERWPECDQEVVERLAACGAVFRALAVIEWDSHHLAHDWADSFVPNLRLYEAELAHAAGQLGLTRRSGATSRRPALEGLAG
jgi:ATP-binding cassette subfamily B protein